MSTPLDRLLELDVAILGGGFAGVYCAKELRRRIGRRPGVRIGIVSEQNYMVFQPMLPEVAGGGLSPKHVVNPIRQLCRGIDVFKGRVESVDLDRRQFRLSAGAHSQDVTVKFDHLVLALGAQIDLSRVPGMPEHAYLMQNVGDAMKLHSAVIGRCEEANLETRPQAKRTLLTFVVVGGGYSGVETAGQILDMLHGVGRYYNRFDSSDYRVILIHSGEHILPSLSPKLAQYAEQKLRAAGLQIILGQRVKAVTSNRVYLTDGRQIAANTVVCTVGNGPHPVVRQLCEQYGVKHERGRVCTLNTLQVCDQPQLWAAGDCACVPREVGGDCPCTAQFAVRQGKICGRNIANTYDGKLCVPFTFSGLGELAAIGKRKAVASICGLHISGFFAWWLWRTVYLMKLPGFERKLRVMLDWTLDLFFAKDVNLLNPEHTKHLNRIHLEPGDHLFNAGDPPQSLYVVIRGRIDLLEGDRVVRSVLPGEYVGERALTKNLPYIYDAVAAEATEVTSLDGQVFLTLAEHSVVLRRIFKRTATQYKTVDEMRKLKARLAPSVAGKTAGEIMQSDLVTLQANLTLADALTQIKARRHSSYPIVDDRNEYVGTISREDIFCALKSSSTSLDTPIGELDHRELPVVDTRVQAAELIEALLTHGANKVMVQSAEGALVGIVTLLDLVCESAAEVGDEQCELLATSAAP